ncbi:MAG TPA: substrate-binding domain-containing protein [Spirochaetales bacterium]|nr:substrate-binding domain-containing protein [Spirochaetales bacterium]HRY56335.1 substrate-binding domain-containing protein [Spirochaetia bacterium]HRZ65580.1 substrate-binding domain-containing protein [Spirochaetia bacterium]
MKELDRDSPIPLHHQLYELLKEWFTTEAAPSGFLPSEVELAERFGLSRGTVRIALDRLVKDDLIVRDAGRGTALKPDYLVKLKKYRIGVVLSEIDFFTDTIWEYSRTSHLEVINGIIESNIPFNLSTELFSEDTFSEACNRDFDGFILWPYVHQSLTKRLSKPYMQMRYSIDLIDGFAKIAADLVANGLGRIGYIGFDSRGRIETMDRVLGEAGLPPIRAEAIIECGGNQAEAYRSCVELLDRGIDLDCIVCSTDIRAYGVLQCLEEKGIPVPSRIAVYGFDGPRRPRSNGKSITTCRFDWTYPGRFAVESIRRLLDGASPQDYSPPKGIIWHGETTQLASREQSEEKAP